MTFDLDESREWLMNNIDWPHSAEHQLSAACEEVERLLSACHEIEQTLGKALGYPVLGERTRPDGTKETCDPAAEGALATDVVCVGEHVAETLAMEAANVIERLRAENAELREQVADCEKYHTDPNPQIVKLVAHLRAVLPYARKACLNDAVGYAKVAAAEEAAK